MLWDEFFCYNEEDFIFVCFGVINFGLVDFIFFVNVVYSVE